MDKDEPTMKDISDGLKNHHIHFCDYKEQRRFYCACVFRIEKFEKGALDVGEEGTKTETGDCANAISKGVCPAIKMHNEEREAGKPIYFTRSINLNTKSGMTEKGKNVRVQDSYLRGWTTMQRQEMRANGQKPEIPRSKPSPAKSSAKSPKESKPEQRTDAFQDATSKIISDMAKEESKKPEKSKKLGNMLEIAKRMKEQRK